MLQHVRLCHVYMSYYAIIRHDMSSYAGAAAAGPRTSTPRASGGPPTSTSGDPVQDNNNYNSIQTKNYNIYITIHNLNT